MSDEDNIPFDENPFSSSDGVLVVDNDGRVLMMNSVMKEMWNMPEDVSEAKKVSDIIRYIVKESSDPVPIIDGASKVLGVNNSILKSEILLKNSKVVSVHTFPMTGTDYKIHGRIWYTRDITEEKKIEDLRNLQNLMMENLGEGVVMVRDKDGTIVYTNSCFNRMFGYSPGELLHKHISVINAPTEIGSKEKSEEINKILREKGSWSGVVKNIKKNGEHVWSEVRVSSVNNSQYGRVWVSLQNDITNKVKADKEQRYLSKRFYLLFENSLVPMMFITADGGVLMANKEACKLFGRSEKEIIKIGGKGLINHLDKRFEKLSEIRKKTGSFRGEFTVIHKDGHLIEVEGVSKVFIDDDGVEHSHIILRDRTSYYDKARKLEQSNMLYEVLFESAEYPVVIWDPESWKVVKANKSAIKRLQMSGLEELQASGGPEIFSPGDAHGIAHAREMIKKMGMKAIKKGSVVFPWIHKTKEGRTYPVEVKLTRIKVGDRVLLQAIIKKEAK